MQTAKFYQRRSIDFSLLSSCLPLTPLRSSFARRFFFWGFGYFGKQKEVGGKASDVREGKRINKPEDRPHRLCSYANQYVSDFLGSFFLTAEAQSWRFACEKG
jgi:hypothetical protein